MVGTHNLSSPSENTKQIHKVEQIITHPQYSNGFLYPNDISLLKLVDRIKYQTNEDGFGNAASVKLISKKQGDSELVTVGSDVFSAGWGSSDLTKRSQLNDIPKFDEYKIIDIENCLKEKIDKDKCIGSKLCVEMSINKSLFYGDSGNPLLLYKDNQVLLVGVASHLARLSYDSHILKWENSFYSRVSHYVDWIETVTGPLY